MTCEGTTGCGCQHSGGGSWEEWVGTETELLLRGVICINTCVTDMDESLLSYPWKDGKSSRERPASNHIEEEAA